MGYRILYDNQILFDPYTDDRITDAKLSSKTNAASYFDFTMARTHSLYNTIAERAGEVRVCFDDLILFKGEITKIEDDFDGNHAVSCTGVLDFLGDTRVRPYSTVDGEQPLKAPTSVDGYFQWLIDQHNSNCLDSRKQFSVGVNQGNMLDKNNYIYRSSEQRPTTASEIEDKILNSLGGYLFVRFNGDQNILDLYADAHEANTQIIDFGVNITDFTKTTTTDDQYTAVVATGYTPDPPEGQTDVKMKPITLEGCPDGGTPYSSTIVKMGDRVYDVNAVARYGYREYYVSNTDIKTYDGLLEYACKTLNTLLSPALSITVKAVDLALYMNNNYEHLQLGQAARVRSKPHNVDEYLMVNSIELDLNNPGNTEFELGASYDTLTGQQSAYLKSLNSSINSSLDTVAALDDNVKNSAKLAQEAKDTADAATDVATDAGNKADAATSVANDASAKADTATSTANTANSKADTANNTANKANDTANAANKTANSASSKADTANSTANKANETANTANNTANKANDTANAANDTANKANTTADTANKTANAASSKADTANDTANKADTKADQAIASASTANDKANSASSKADDAAKKAEQTQESIKLVQKDVDAANEAASNAQASADAASTAASAAQATANTAKANASKAQTAADNAQSSADAANSAASKAQESANAANSAIADTNKEVGTINNTITQIKQDAADTRDELSGQIETVKKTMTADYAKKTELSETEGTLRSEIESSAAGIKSEVSQNYTTKTELSKTNDNVTKAQNTADKAAAAAATNASDLNNAIKTIGKTTDDLQSQIDGSIQTWFEDGVPTNLNYPAIDWTTDTIKKNHLGDLYYDNTTGYGYRWQIDQNGSYSWKRIVDTDVTKALADAAKAQGTANSKRRIFVTTPVPPYDVADLWVQGTTGDILRCQTAKTEGQSYAAADWVKASKYTDDTAVTKLAETVSVTYATKTTVNQLSDRIEQTVESVETVSASASAAQSAADKANEAAKAAQSTADTAKANAATAQTSANNAKSAADAAQKAADNAKTAAATAQTAADNANADLAVAKKNLEAVQNQADATDEQVAAAKSAVEKAQTAADKANTAAANAKSAADAAQSTADSAKTNATNAQATADVAKANASKAQTTADTAVANAKKAQDDVNAVKSRVTAAETSIKQNSEQIALRATKTEVTNAIDAISVGGRNLLPLTKLVRANYWSTDYQNGWLTAKDDSDSRSWGYVNSDWKDIQLKAGAYIISIEVKRYTDWVPSSGKIFTSGDKVIGNLTFDYFKEVGTKRYPFTLDSDSTIGVMVKFGNDTGKTPGICRFWIQEGTKPTDWSPAPEDVASDASTKANNALASAKTYTDAQLKITSDSITSTVSKTYATKTDLSTTNSNVTKAQSTADTANTAASKAQQTADAVTKNLSDNYTTTKDMNSKIEQTASNITSTVSETYATKAALSTTNSNVSKAQTAADNAQSSADAVKKNLADNYTTTVDMNSKIEQTASGITSTVSKTYATKTDLSTTNANVTKAQTTADNAGNAASAAQSTADTAVTKANNAQGTANGAVSKADKAQSDVDAVTTRMSSAETKITQNSDQIALRATKTELNRVSHDSPNLIVRSNMVASFTNTVGDLNSSDASTVADNYYGDASTKQLIPVSGSDILSISKLEATSDTISNGYTGLVAAFDSDMKFIRILSPKIAPTRSAKTWLWELPSNCAYIRIGIYHYPICKWSAQIVPDYKGDASTKANNALASAKSYADSQIKISADGITSTVSKTYATKTDLSTTNSNVTKAQSTADSANTAAGKAQTTANTAVNEAGKANTAASNAQTTADSAVSKADAAQTSANDAQTAADNAQTAADAAQGTANSASTAASKAQSTADTGVANAKKAQDTANSAVSKADAAQTTANTGVANAKKAQDTADAVKLDLSTNYTTTTDMRSEIKQTADSITSTVSKTYATITTVNNLQNIADNAIESWYLAGVPTEKNEPASKWDTAALKKQHAGDMYYDKNTGYSYRWLTDDSGAYSWVRIKDNDIAAATSKADAAQTAANKAQTTADSGVSKANAAQSTANTAVSKADAAQTTANTGVTNAKKAQATADAASTAASNAQTTADTGVANAKTAQSTADSAVSKANAAQSTANTGVANAKKAQDTADAASTAASNAQTTANSGVSKAEAAQKTADAIKTDLATNYTTTEDMRSEISQSAEGITSTVSKTYATKSELATTNNNVTKAQADATAAGTAASKAQTTANSATSAASKAQTTANSAVTAASNAQSSADSAGEAASAAQTTADSAVSKANAAQNTANSGVSKANAAQNTANTAVSKADAAQSKADSVGSNLAANYTPKMLPDTRNDNQNPQWYMTNYPMQTITEFKNTSKIGLTGDTYCTLLTEIPWVDNSGGYPKQTASVLAKKYWRTGVSGTEWGAWVDITGLANRAQETADSVGNDLHTNYTTTTDMRSEIKQSADGITSTVSKTYATKTELSTTNSNVTAAKNAASSAQSTADTAVANAKTAQSTAEAAQSTANTGVANAKTAQNTANTAVANAKTAQSTADTAKANAKTAQDTADGVKADLKANYTTTTDMESKISQSAEGITSSVSKTYATKSELSTTNTNVSKAQSTADSGVSKANAAQTTANSASSKADAAQNTANSATTKANNAQTAANNAQNTANRKGIDYSQGKMLYTDPTFNSLNNSCGIYNNSGNGTVTLTRTGKSSDNPIRDATNELQIKTAGTASPGLGGFCQAPMTRANAVFIGRVIAKIPVGYNINIMTNQTGDNSSLNWLTSQNGTGKFTEYVVKLVCGATGSFSTSFHYYLTGPAATSSNPVIWYVAYATAFDMTDVGDALTANRNVQTLKTNVETNYATKSLVSQTSENIKSEVSKTYSTKTELSTTNSKIDNLSVGGRNLFIGSKSTPLSISGFNGTPIDGYTNIHTETIDGYSVAYWRVSPNTSNVGPYFYFNKQGRLPDRKNGEYWTISFDAKGDISGVLKASVIESQNPLNWSLSYGTEWTRCFFSALITNEGKQAFVFYSSGVGVTSVDNARIYIRRIKIEYGNKPTDWTPAPEDVDASIATVDNKFKSYSTTEQTKSLINQSAESIKSEVSKTYQVKGDYATNASVKSAIDQSASAITSTVESTYATKATVDALKNIADNAIESWSGTGVPTLTNKPASDWTTDALKNQHLGDLYYDKSTGYGYRFNQNGSTYSWDLIRDSGVTKALADAAAANTAASKAQTTANSGVSKADAAQTTANSAKTAASNAQSTADTAKANAATAQSDVNKLKTDIPNTYATKSSLTQTASDITAKVETAQSTADGAVTAASKAQQTADSISTNLSKNYTTTTDADKKYATQSSLTQTANSLTSKISSVETATTKAQTDATSAIGKANQAQTDANALKTRMTSAETSIKQNTNAIALRATKTEVESTYSKRVYAHYTGKGSSDKYFKLAVIKITGYFVNRPIVMTLINRGRLATDVQIVFSSGSTLDPILISLVQSRGIGVYIHKDTTSTWTLYCDKSENYDDVTIVNFSNDTRQSISVVFEGGNASLPENSVTASKLMNGNSSSDYYTKTETNAQIKVSADSITSTVSSVRTIAEAAKSTADTAKSTADTATTTANTAKSTADTAKKAADAASSTADTASSNASSALSKASTAETNASSAKTTAEAANTAAATAKSTADTASSNASSALSKASTAETNASSAKTTAEAANKTAGEAKSAASSANSTASSALTKANSAASDASAAKSDAATAKTTANTANSTANTAKSTADTARNELSNLKIGGENLISNLSDNWANGKCWNIPAVGSATVLENYTGRIALSRYVPITPSTDYWIKLYTSKSIYVLFQVLDSDQNFLSTVTGLTNQKWTSPANAYYLAVVIYEGVTTSDIQNGAVKIKLEKGNRPTDYSPASEDIPQSLQPSIDKAQNTADALGEKITKECVTQTQFEQTSTSLTSRIQTTETTVSNMSTTVKNVEDYMTFARENEQPTLTIGSSSSSFRTKLTNTGEKFMQGDQTIMELDGVTSTVKTSRVQLGHYQWRDTGTSMQLVYIP